MPTHFSPEALQFLRGLARNNRRDWFDARKAVYERELKAPMLALIEEINGELLDFAPEHIRPAQKCMFRIYRDTRFSPDKTPYKKHISAWWARQGLEKKSGGGFYFHLSAKELVIAAGVYMPEREQLLAIRNHLLDHHEEFRRLLKDRKLQRLMTEFDGLRLTRPPKGFPKDHPAMDLLACRQWGVSATLPAEMALQPTLRKEIVSRFKIAAPLIEFLNRPLATQSASRVSSPVSLF
ncbi:MAG TPA: DUF2461 domain-containing protein [Acidobacteriaceae bacterium]|nr:DUF2461 domain-containing protein [Acidobacteriaceae bacterium]